MSAVEIRSLNGHKIADETARKSVEQAKTESKQYTDTKISQLINSAPTTLDTLGEIAAAMAENATVVEALDAAIGSKADKTYVDEAIANFPAGEPDWEANEGEEGYIKNRTHWEEEATPITVFEEQDVELIADRYVACSTHLGFVLKPDTKYRVIFNGKEYEGVSYWKDENKDCIYLFNELYNNDNLEDFFCVNSSWLDDGDAITYLEVRDEDAGVYSFALYELVTKVHQLDPKFISTATEDQLIQLLMDIDAFPAMTDKNGSIFTHNDSILLI